MASKDYVTDDEIVRVFSAALNPDLVHVNQRLIIDIVRACIEADRERWQQDYLSSVQKALKSFARKTGVQLK